MLNFLSPIWLSAAAAILIPVVIHLWNIRPGKVLKVGSISLISAASRRSSRSFKLMDIPLLILRCLLLILLALLLAVPFLQKRIHMAKPKGWILLPKENFSEAYTKFKTAIDSLTAHGYEFHYFNSGFRKVDLNKLLTEAKDIRSIDSALNSPQQYWNLLKQLDTKVASETPVYLFTPNTISHFSGEKPALALNLTWKTFTPADSASTWVQDAWLTASNTIRVVKGTGNPSGIKYEYFNIQGDKGSSQFKIEVNNGKPVVSLANGKSKAIDADTNTLRIAIYTDKYTADAGYLKAALQSVAQFTQRKVIIKQYSSVSAMPLTNSWVFWLSDHPYYAKLVQPGVKMFVYQQGKEISADSWLSAGDNYSLPNGKGQVPLFKVISGGIRSGNVIWRDGYGHPVLVEEPQEKVTVFHFFSRFNPTWSDLVWDSRFPELLMGAIYDAPAEISSVNDKRALSDAAIAPEKINQQHVIADKFTVQEQLGFYFWLGLIAVFLAERWLATRNKTIQANG